MPYSNSFYQKQRAFRSIGSLNWSNGDFISAFDISLSPTAVVGWSEVRDGTNSSISDQLQLYGPVAFDKVIRNVVVGFDYKLVEKTVYYRDARGRLRSKIKSKTVRVPRKVRTLTLVRKQAYDGPVADRSKFLKPNLLQYRRASSFMAPESLVVHSDVPGQFSDLVRLKTAISISGPGNFFHPVPPGYGGSGTILDGYYQLGTSVDYPPGYPSPDPYLEQEALKKLIDKISSSLPDYFLTIAESDKTVALLKATLIEALKLGKKLLKLQFRELAGSFKKHSSLKSLSDHWLAWWYGIMPTVYDVQDTLAFLQEKERLWRSYSSSAKNENKMSYGPVLGVGNIAGKTDYSYIHTVKFGVIVEGKLGFDDYLAKASNPLAQAGLIYELIPFSFVLDWIIDIGTYLAGLTILQDKLYHAWETVVTEESEVTSGRFVNNVFSPERRHSSGPFVAGFSKIAVHRVPLLELPAMRFPRVTKPVINQAWAKKSMTSLALTVQQLHRFFPKS